MSDSVSAEKKQELSDYTRLIEAFLGNRIDAARFENRYLGMFKNDATLWQGQEYETLNGLFSDIDAFCADVSIRDEDDLDESELRAQAKNALRILKSLQ